MSKRSLEDAEAANGAAESRIKKKSKKEKSAPVAETPVAEAVDNAEPEVESKEARKERKKLKKARKVAEQGDSASEPAVDSVGQKEGGNDDDEEAAEQAKLAKKAAKAAKKDAKATEKSQKSTAVEDVDADKEPVVTSTLAAPANLTYTESPALKALPQATIDAFLTKHFISITDPTSKKPEFRPIIEFSHLPAATTTSGIDPFKDFKNPSPIQAASWPFLLAGRDVVGVAETGSGKTMAFAVPCVRAIAALPKKKQFKGPKAVVVSPTRELAMQSHEQILKLVASQNLQCVCVYGGVDKSPQRKALATADIVVATPGRLNDLIDEGSANLSRVSYVVLDEADRMLDKGFEADIRKIIGHALPLGQRQTLMFTATWPESVRTLAATFMTTPIKIAIGDNPTGDLRANTRIVQKVEVVEPHAKEFRLLQLLKQYQSGSSANDKILVFCLYKKEAARVEQFLRGKGIKVAGINGDLSQEQRTRSLEAFKTGGTPILVATDVAARGLDIPSVKVVINLTFPLTVEDYVHRIGRTGRAGKEGLAITLFTEHDKAQSGSLINVLKAANQPVPDELLKFGTTVKKKAHDAYGAFFKDVDSTKVATKVKFDD